MNWIILAKGVLAKILLGLSGIFLARLFTKQEYGLLVSISSIVTFTLIICRLGLQEKILISASASKNTSIRNALIRRLDIFQTSLALLMMVPACLISNLLVKTEFTYQVVSIFFLLIYLKGFIELTRTGILATDLQASLKNNHFTNLQLIMALGATASTLATYLLKYKIYGYIFTSTAFSCIFYALSVQAIKKHLSTTKLLSIKLVGKNLFVITFKSALVRDRHYLISDITSYLYAQGGALLLILLTSSSEVASYSVVSALIVAGYIVPGAIYQWSLSTLSALKSNKDRFLNEARKLFMQIAMLCIPPGIFLYFFSNWCIAILFGDKYSSSALILKYLAFVFILHSLCFIPAACLSVLGAQKYRSRIQVISAIIGTITTLLLASSLGGLAAAIGALLGEIFLFTGYISATYYAFKRL